MAEPIAYFLTFTTYGTWLHGDERGSVDDRHHVYGLAKATPNRDKYKRNFEKLKWPPFTLDAKARGIVELTIEQVAKHRKWNLKAVNVRTNHVHVVVEAGYSADKTLSDFKAWCTRRLREAGCVEPPEREVWTEGGSTRLVFDGQGLAAVIQYTKFGQGPDLPKEL
jgi:hypothetical protein